MDEIKNFEKIILNCKNKKDLKIIFEFLKIFKSSLFLGYVYSNGNEGYFENIKPILENLKELLKICKKRLKTLKNEN